MVKAYVVAGFTGAWEDAIDWSVRAFVSKEKAQKFVDDANQWLKDNGFYRIEKGDKKLWNVDYHPECPFDKNLCVDFNGTSYSMEEIDLDLGRKISKKD